MAVRGQSAMGEGLDCGRYASVQLRHFRLTRMGHIRLTLTVFGLLLHLIELPKTSKLFGVV